VLQAALAARDAALDRHKLASSAGAAQALRPDTVVVGDTSARGTVTVAGAAVPVHPETARVDSLRRAAREMVSAGSVPYVVTLAQHRAPARVVEDPRAVPDVHGLSLRDAVRLLHGAGFHVRLVRGNDGATEPAAGSIAAPGSVVRLFHDF
jgi:hypothetical protein